MLQASLRLAALDVSGPTVVAVEISASYIKNNGLQDSLKFELSRNNQTEPVTFTQKLGQQCITFMVLFALASCIFFKMRTMCLKIILIKFQHPVPIDIVMAPFLLQPPLSELEIHVLWEPVGVCAQEAAKAPQRSG